MMLMLGSIANSHAELSRITVSRKQLSTDQLAHPIRGTYLRVQKTKFAART